VLAAAGAVAALSPGVGGWTAGALARFGTRLGRGTWVAGLALLALFPLAVLGSYGRFLEPISVRLIGLWGVALATASLLGGVRRGRSFDDRLAATLLVGGAVYLGATFLIGITRYPLSLSWSEASRYYYASLFLSERVYGQTVAPSVLHPSRYLLQAIPFLLPESAIALHRVWNVVLWLGLPALTASLLVRRLRVEGRGLRWMVGIWVVLFLFQGPILFQLLVPVIVVLAGVRPRRFWTSLAIVALGSAWAGLSRINWISVPGFLATALYLLERPRQRETVLRYWARPLIWTAVGSGVALATYSGYILLSGNEPEQFGSSFTSDLLIYRLLPNRTFPLGMLGGIGLASLPILLLIGRWLRSGGRSLRADRWVPLDAMLGVLGVGGLIVSLKIGGGSNLHNLDAYLILLGVIAGYLYFGRAAGIEPARDRVGWGRHALLIAVPLFFVLSTGAAVPARDREFAQGVVQQIQDAIDSLGTPEPRVLFISERQLLTFGEVGPLELIPDYEKVFLMEMAMSGTRSYLDRFHAELEAQRFDLIVSEPLAIQYQGRSHAFGEENDAWVREVSEPVLCAYEPILTAQEAAVQVFAPKEGEVACP
jgi:hypothetical protein